MSEYSAQEKVALLKADKSVKAKRHAEVLEKQDKVIRQALGDPSFAATLYVPTKGDSKDYDKSIVQREVYEAYKAAGRTSELPKMNDIKELWEKYGKGAKLETLIEVDKDGVVVVAHTGKYLGVSDKSSLSRYGAGQMNRDGMSWHNHPDNGPDGRSYGFPPSPHDVNELLLKGHRTWFVGTSEGVYEMTIRDSSAFREMGGKGLVKAAKKLQGEIHNTWLEVLRVAPKGSMRDKENGVLFTNVLNQVLKEKLGEAGIDYRFKPSLPGFNEV